MIHGHLDHHGTSIGHQAISGFVAHDAIMRSGNADRAALIATGGQFAIASRDGSATAARRAARRMGRLVRIAHRSERAGVATARERHILAIRLAENGAAGIENAGNNGCIDIGDIALEEAAAVHHRHAGNADRVFDANLEALENSLARAFDFRAPVPCIIGVVLRLRALSRGARIFDLGLILGHRINTTRRIDRPLHEAAIEHRILFAHFDAE